MLNLLLGLHEGFGLTYVFISHELAVVNCMSDNIPVMNPGEMTICIPVEM